MVESQKGQSVKTLNVVMTAAAAVFAFTTASSAAGLAEQFASCAAKFANPKVGATVMLECTAGDGKLSGCKVLEAPTPANGFDKAAMCVAEALPVGSRTGAIKVPVKFDPN
jgi:hypothetical protein